MPLEISLNILIKYTGDYRIEREGDKYKLIKLLKSERKKEFEKLFINIVKPIITINGGDTLIPFFIVKVVIPIKNAVVVNFKKVAYCYDWMEYVFGDNDEDVVFEPGTLKKFQVIKKLYECERRPLRLESHYNYYNLSSASLKLFKINETYYEYVDINNYESNRIRDLDFDDIDCVAELCD